MKFGHCNFFGAGSRHRRQPYSYSKFIAYLIFPRRWISKLYFKDETVVYLFLMDPYYSISIAINGQSFARRTHMRELITFYTVCYELRFRVLSPMDMVFHKYAWQQIIHCSLNAKEREASV
jgi:hypothetical protein